MSTISETGFGIQDSGFGDLAFSIQTATLAMPAPNG
jgi:hypothetical protein